MNLIERSNQFIFDYLKSNFQIILYDSGKTTICRNGTDDVVALTDAVIAHIASEIFRAAQSQGQHLKICVARTKAQILFALVRHKDLPIPPVSVTSFFFILF